MIHLFSLVAFIKALITSDIMWMIFSGVLIILGATVVDIPCKKGKEQNVVPKNPPEKISNLKNEDCEGNGTFLV